MSSPDSFGWYVATMHQLLGHDKAAAAMGVQPGDKGSCLICAFERDPSPANREAVISVLAR